MEINYLINVCIVCIMSDLGYAHLYVNIDMDFIEIQLLPVCKYFLKPLTFVTFYL